MKRYIISTILLVILSLGVYSYIANAAVVLGTSAGFVAIAPTANPAGTAQKTDTLASTLKDTSPADATKVTEIGWWCDNATEETNFAVGIYTHDAANDKPDAKVGSFYQTNAKGTGAGWKKVTVNIPVSASTVYWIAIQVDDTATQTNHDYSTVSGSRSDVKTLQAGGLTDPWGNTTTAYTNKAISIYAVYSTVAAPTVTTQSASSVSITTATLNGNITDAGAPAPTVRGFAWGTNSALSGGDTATTTDTNGQPFGTGAFTGAPSSSLTCNTTYYSRAYATNSAGTGLGAISASFTTSSCTSAPTVTTQDPTDKNITSVTANGNITATNGANATVRGFAYGTDPTLSTVISTTTDTSGQPFGTGAFTGAISSLIKGTNYYIRAYATNSSGTGFGSIKSFTTTIQSDVIIFGSNTVLGRDVILK